MKYINIVLDIYRCSVLVLIGPDRDSFIKGYPNVFKKLHCEGNLEQDIDDLKEVLKAPCKGTTFGFSNCPVDACVILYGDTISDLSNEIVVHELYHAMKHICAEHGIEDEESEAYILEYLCHQFWNAQDEWNKKHSID